MHPTQQYLEETKATQELITHLTQMLKTDMFDDTNKWYHFSANLMDRETVKLDEGIHLYHRQRIHCDVVLSVHKLSTQFQ